jgi:hypothetical protein
MEHFITEKRDTAKQKLDSILRETYSTFQAPSDHPEAYTTKPNPRFPIAKPLSKQPTKPRFNPYAITGEETQEPTQLAQT